MRLCLVLVLIIFTSAASATTPQPHLLGLSITADDRATSLEIDLSSRVPLSTVVKPDRIEIDLPTVQWDRSLPAKGKGGGVIDSYRKVPAAHGIAIVLHTNTRVKIDSSEGQPDEAGGQHITIRLVPEVDTYGVVQPTIIYTPPVVGPVVQEPFGTGVETVPAPAVQNQAQPARGNQATKSQSGNCAAHLIQAGRVGDASASYPVYKFSDCP